VVSMKDVEFGLGVLLLSDGGLLDEFLVEDDALVAPFQALFNDSSRLSDHGAGHHEALVIEVGHCGICE
jgi:hypothetical protein